MSGQEVLNFYGWWQFGVCLFAYIALMGIWYHIGRKRQDYGQVWLALSVLCWSLSGIAEIFYSGSISAMDSPHINGWRSIFSLFNSLFILLALPWFKYIPPSIEPIIKSGYWNYIVGLPFLFSFLPTVSKMCFGKNIEIISELDVYYSILTLVFLGMVLWTSFQKRRLMVLSVLSFCCILITFIAQLYKLTGSSINMILFSSIFKSSLIMIFFALALSWVKELSESLNVNHKDIFLNFYKSKQSKGVSKKMITIKGISGNEEKQIQLTPTVYDLLLKFAQRKTKGNDEWLEIKPRNDSRSNKIYDIKDHNEIKRISVGILDSLYGKNAWNKDQHELPLRSTLFELSNKRDRKIKLAIPPENISINLV